MGDRSNKNGVMILGKIPPPYYGPAVATKIILASNLQNDFNLIHVDTRLNTSMETMGQGGIGKVLKTVKIYVDFVIKLFNSNVHLVLVPIAQDTSALFKDSIFILLARLFRKKVLLHLRGSSLLVWYKSRNGFIQWFFKKIFSVSNGAIVLGNNLQYIFEPFIPSNKIFVVPNGVDIDVPKSQPQDKFTILCLSNLQRNKGIKEIIEAVNLLPNEIKENLQLNIVGSWRHEGFEEECRSAVESNDLPIKFFSSVSGNDKFQMYVNSDLFLFTPNAPEGHPWVIVEALAAGLPIISTDQGAIIESVIDGHNGFIVPSNSPSDIAKRVQEIVGDTELRLEMGKNSRKKYENEFTETRMVKKLALAIKRTIENG